MGRGMDHTRGMCVPGWPGPPDGLQPGRHSMIAEPNGSFSPVCIYSLYRPRSADIPSHSEEPPNMWARLTLPGGRLRVQSRGQGRADYTRHTRCRVDWMLAHLALTADPFGFSTRLFRFPLDIQDPPSCSPNRDPFGVLWRMSVVTLTTWAMSTRERANVWEGIGGQL